nr:MFS transporter [Thermoplasmata archaeon]NIS11153.1 MFS transporter [Thermoplasmata archaeon]NIS19092.1 MFS transporter [Thermoplasmata archaeon]NIT76151.1 MFS transporter [Thermoplasmata archaeon]NIU48236.1 MFS transporter [Thermoplasmata archaeon]
LSPLAGVVVDRYSRKTIMIVSDSMTAVSTLSILLFHQADMLTQWSVYGLVSIAGVSRAFQFPALSAATTLMVPKEHYGRASGMLSTAWALSDMLAPIMAAVLWGIIGLSGILTIDLITFGVAVVALLIVHIPAPKASEEGERAKASWWDDITYGWRYILARRGLLLLLTFFFLSNLIGTLGWVLLQPMILAKTANNEVILGTVMMIGGLGGIIGGITMSVWGGPKRRVRGIVWGVFIGGGIGTMVLGLNGGIVVWAAGLFLWTVTDAPTMGSSQSIWQSKVPPDRQGRVFSVRFFIALIGALPAMLIAGPLADYVFEPFMEDATGVLGWLFGSGPGAGMGLMIFLCGAVMAVVAILARGSKQLWQIENILPDHEEEPEGKDEDGDEDRDGNEDGDGPSEESPEEGSSEAHEPGGPPEEGPDQAGGELDVALLDDGVQ